MATKKKTTWLTSLINQQILLLDHFGDNLSSTKPCTLIELDFDARLYVVECEGITSGISMDEVGAVRALNEKETEKE
jgi:hypothetical protein